MTNNISSTARLSDRTLNELLAALAGDKPTPGGGSVTAWVGALGSALVAMVAGLTIGRARYANVQHDMIGLRDQAIALQQNLVEMAEADAAAFNQVMAAYDLPKAAADRITRRSAAIQDALRDAIDVPLAVAAACVDVLGLAGQVAAQGNRNAASDAAVAALIAHAGLRGAARNVRANLPDLNDAKFRATAELRVAQLLTAGQAALAAALTAADAGD